jgi:hypothetical protein
MDADSVETVDAVYGGDGIDHAGAQEERPAAYPGAVGKMDDEAGVVAALLLGIDDLDVTKGYIRVGRELLAGNPQEVGW